MLLTLIGKVSNATSHIKIIDFYHDACTIVRELKVALETSELICSYARPRPSTKIENVSYYHSVIAARMNPSSVRFIRFFFSFIYFSKVDPILYQFAWVDQPCRP